MLHTAAFGHPATHVEWRARLERHSLTWVTARDPGGRLTGFVNVVGDGGEHAFLLDTVVSPADQRTGIGRSLVDAAEEAARGLGCRWLHVDYEPRDAAFYEAASGFRPTPAGLRDLSEPRPQPGDEDSEPGLDPRYLKYARVERERRWLLSAAPDLATATRTLEIRDRYLRGTRLRFREVSEADGTVVRKLGHKVRLGDGPGEVACTSIYLDDTEWDLLASCLPTSWRSGGPCFLSPAGRWPSTCSGDISSASCWPRSTAQVGSPSTCRRPSRPWAR